MRKAINIMCNVLIVVYGVLAMMNLGDIDSKALKTIVEGAGGGCGLGVLIMLYSERQKAKKNKLEIGFYREKAKFAVDNLYWCYEKMDEKNKTIKDLKKKKISLRQHIRKKGV